MSQEHLIEPQIESQPDTSIDTAEKTSKKIPRKTKVYTGFFGFLCFMLVLALFFHYNFKTVEVRGESMEPTLHSGGRLLVSDAYWLIGDIKPDDIVVIKNSAEEDVIIKRVYKVGGQEVDLQNAPEGYDITLGPFIVPEGTIFVLGDNISVSQDSRHYGPFDVKDVIGKMVVVQPLLGGAAKSNSE